MSEEEAFITAVAATPEEDTPRLVYADWLDERGLSGGEYLRAEVALLRATGDTVAETRRAFLDVHARTDTRRRDRFEQPDLLRVTPTPFESGWYGVQLTGCRANRGTYTLHPYRSLPNLNRDRLTTDTSWLPPRHLTITRPDIARYEQAELALIGPTEQRVAERGAVLPAGFAAFFRDFGLRRGVAPYTYCEFGLEIGFVSVPGDSGFLLTYFFDGNYAELEDMLSWALYLVPGTSYHCVVVLEPMDDALGNVVPNLQTVRYCAPSFHAFVYRWWLENRLWRRLHWQPGTSYHISEPMLPDERAYLSHYHPTTR